MGGREREHFINIQCFRRKTHKNQFTRVVASHTYTNRKSIVGGADEHVARACGRLRRVGSRVLKCSVREMIAESGQNLLETAKERGRVQRGDDHGRFLRGLSTELGAQTDRTLSSTYCAHDLNRPLKLKQHHVFEVRVGVSGRE